MKIQVFRTQLRIGSPVRYNGKEYRVIDFDRTKKEINISKNMWIRFSEVELISSHER